MRVSAAIAAAREYNKELIEYLKQGTPESPGPLDDLVQRFTEMIRHSDCNFGIVCFYENRHTDFSAKIKKLELPERYTKNLDKNGHGIVRMDFRDLICSYFCRLAPVNDKMNRLSPKTLPAFKA